MLISLMVAWGAYADECRGLYKNVRACLLGIGFGAIVTFVN